MTRDMARLLVKIGIALLALSLLCRFIATTASARMGDNLAIIACVLMIAVGVLYIRFSKRTHAADVATAKVLLAKDRRYGYLAEEPVLDPALEEREARAANGGLRAQIRATTRHKQ